MKKRKTSILLICITLCAFIIITYTKRNKTDELTSISENANATEKKDENSDESGKVKSHAASFNRADTFESNEITYDQYDYDVNWKDEVLNYVELDGSSIKFSGTGVFVEDNEITINGAGTYIVSGTLEDGQIRIEETEGVVRIILNGAIVDCSYGPSIYIKNNDKTIITLAPETRNYLNNSLYYKAEYEEQDEIAPRAVLFSNGEITINGSGNLTINSNIGDAINVKSTLKIMSGSYNIKSKENAVLADNMAVKDASFTIKSEKDALVSSGVILIDGGNYSIETVDEAIHANKLITINAGVVSVLKSNVGIESPFISINGGNIQITTSDNGINIVDNSQALLQNFITESKSQLIVNDGYLYVDSSGDGINAEGNIVMNGGVVVINGPTDNENSSIEYKDTFTMSGGEFIAADYEDGGQMPSQVSTQPTISLKFLKEQKAGTMVQLVDNDDKSVIAFSPRKQFKNIVISSKDLKLDNTYKVYLGSEIIGSVKNGRYEAESFVKGVEITEITLEDSVYNWTENE